MQRKKNDRNKFHFFSLFYIMRNLTYREKNLLKLKTMNLNQKKCNFFHKSRNKSSTNKFSLTNDATKTASLDHCGFPPERNFNTLAITVSHFH